MNPTRASTADETVLQPGAVAIHKLNLGRSYYIQEHVTVPNQFLARSLCNVTLILHQYTLIDHQVKQIKNHNLRTVGRECASFNPQRTIEVHQHTNLL